MSEYGATRIYDGQIDFWKKFKNWQNYSAHGRPRTRTY